MLFCLRYNYTNKSSRKLLYKIGCIKIKCEKVGRKKNTRHGCEKRESLSKAFFFLNKTIFLFFPNLNSNILHQLL